MKHTLATLRDLARANADDPLWPGVAVVAALIVQTPLWALVVETF